MTNSFNEILSNLIKTSAGYRKALAQEEGFPQDFPAEEGSPKEYNMELEEVVERLNEFKEEWEDKEHQYYTDIVQLLDEIEGGSAEIPVDIESFELPGDQGFGGCGCGCSKNKSKAGGGLNGISGRDIGACCLQDGGHCINNIRRQQCSNLKGEFFNDTNCGGPYQSSCPKKPNP
jgi:hypothetical protein